MCGTRWARWTTAIFTFFLAPWLLAGTGALLAQDGPSATDDAPARVEAAATATSAQAASGAGSWVVRSLVLGALINGESDGDLDLDTSEDITVGADVTYFVSDRLALNLLAAFVNPEVSSGNEAFGELGSVKAVPPALTLQYHLAPEEKVRPYVGAGVSYTNFFAVSGKLDDVEAEIEDGLGVAGQAGLNVMLTDVVSFAADFRWVFILNDPEVTTTAGTDELDVDWPIIAVGLGFHP